jgi:hypothetical protein
VFTRHRQPAGPMWPYVGLLGLLFALSITAPRDWTVKPHRAARPMPLQARRIVPIAAALSLDAPRRAPREAAAPRMPTLAPRRREPAGPRCPVGYAVTVDGLPELGAPAAPPAESAFQRLAPRVPRSAVTVAAVLESVDNEVPVEEEAPTAPVVETVEHLALAPATTSDSIDVQAPEFTAVEQDELVPAVTPRADWIAPTALLVQLEQLVGDCETGAWAMATIDAVRTFSAVDPHDLDAAAPALGDVWRRRFEGDALSESLAEPALATRVRRACDALERRLKVWDAALDRQQMLRENALDGGDTADLSPALRKAELLLAGRDDAQAWREFLLLDQLRAMNDARASLADDARRELGEQVFNRLTAPTLSSEERKLLGDRDIQRLSEALRGWSSAQEEFFELARNVERYEVAYSPSDAQLLAGEARRLALSSEESDRELSWTLNQRYRNANVRLEFTADLISRLLPESEPRDQAVSETILGVPNRGHSRTTTRLSFRTAENRRRLHMELLANGDIDSWTTASSGPARFRNEGRANFSARRRLRFDRRGLYAEAVEVEVASNTELRGVRTDFDRVPLIGRIIQRVARDQYREKRGAAQQEAERRIEEKVRTELMSETERALAAANVHWRDGVMTPIERLGATPKIIEAGSTPRSATVRLRLAADSQLGAHTPRPRLPQDALLSAQVHQSAINNLLEGLDLNGRSFNLAELGAWLSQKLNRDDLLPASSLRDDVWIHFAEKDAVYARLVDDQIELNITFAEFITTHRSWHNFGVRVRYRPRADELQADLVREGPVELVGDSVRGVEMALRGIVTRMFPDDAPWTLIPAHLATNPRLQGLQVSHFVIDDGWLSVAVGEGGKEVRSQKSEVRR